MFVNEDVAKQQIIYTLLKYRDILKGKNKEKLPIVGQILVDSLQEWSELLDNISTLTEELFSNLDYHGYDFLLSQCNELANKCGITNILSRSDKVLIERKHTEFTIIKNSQKPREEKYQILIDKKQSNESIKNYTVRWSINGFYFDSVDDNLVDYSYEKPYNFFNTDNNFIHTYQHDGVYTVYAEVIPKLLQKDLTKGAAFVTTIIGDANLYSYYNYKNQYKDQKQGFIAQTMDKNSKKTKQYSDALVNFVKQAEHFEPILKDDSNGNLTIGYGHNTKANADTNIYHDVKLTEQQADTLLRSELDKAAKSLNNNLPNVHILRQQEFDALVDRYFHKGSRGFYQDDPLAKLIDDMLKGAIPKILNGYNNNEVVEAFLKNSPTSGETNRRQNQAQLFLYGDYNGYASDPARTNL